MGRRGNQPNLIRADLRHSGQLREILVDLKPSEIYFLAARHSSSESRTSDELATDARAYFEVNHQPLVEIVDTIIKYRLQSKVFVAGSSHVFRPTPAAISEDSLPDPDSFYAKSKLAAWETSIEARDSHGIFISYGILFNHESELRSLNFASARIFQHLVKLSKGQDSDLYLRNPSAKVDWGLAEKFVEGFHGALRLDQPNDFVMASGELHSLQELHDVAAKHFGVNSSIRKTQTRIPADDTYRVGDPSRIRRNLKWVARPQFEEFVADLGGRWAKRYEFEHRQ